MFQRQVERDDFSPSIERQHQKAIMEQSVETYQTVYESILRTEQSKDELIKALLHEVRTIKEQLDSYKMDYERERQYNRQGQQKEAQLTAKLKELYQEMQRDPFVLVLIDGDGMIFEDSFIQNGEAGGKEAANQMWNQIRQYVQSASPTLPLHFKIVARVYANLKGLGDACFRAGITDRSTTMEDFARGFTGAKQLFDFVDVGSGKDRADEKITEMLKLHLNNINCQHVVFGGSHDNGYARLLEDIPSAHRPKILLLEGVPFERELRNFTQEYHHAKLPDLFREAKINIYNPVMTSGGHGAMHPPPGLPHPSLNGNGGHRGANYSMSNGSVESLPTSTSPTNGDAHPAPTRTMSDNQSVVSSRMASWADRVSAPAPPGQASLITVASPQEPQVVPRNKYGQRIDPLMPKPDPNEMRRVSKIKMCNVHFLRRDCPYGDECTHDHSYTPTKGELELLKQINRGTPCRNGSACDDLKCMYGHRCPYSQEGSRTCRFAINCRFDPEMHGLDSKVVRTTKV